MKTVSQVSKLSGVSVRTLHHYDEIGLLSPGRKTDAGYRLYDDADLARLQTILMFRELEFPLKKIREILDSPGFDEAAALSDQLELLRLRKEHLEKLIRLAETKRKEGITLSFEAFDTSKLEAYKREAEKRWGDTEAYGAYREKGKTETQEQTDANGLMEQFVLLGKLKEMSPDDPEAQMAVKNLQEYITGHYYPCTNEILAGLGAMYAEDDRFRENIDKAGGAGTAEFVRAAIREYCR